jgi:BirA family biotin operon repressor/biotin-[acetyl-CoA-carboxylase] ligase
MAAALPEGYRRQAHDTLPSTNAHALDLARGGELGSLWVTAREQSAGRGRRGRAWTTGAGNLAASLLLVDPAPPALAATLSFVAAVALHKAAVDVAGPATAERLALKWPNDLLLDGMKVAGILIEGEPLADGRFAAVAGIGVNCIAHPLIANGLAATDFAERGLTVVVEDLFAQLATRMAEELRRWDRGLGFGETRAAWLARATGLGASVRATLADRTIEGRFETLDEGGRLVILRTDGRRETVTAGDVFLAAAG